MDPHACLDLRSAPARERHRPVFTAFDGLKLGATMELTDARDLRSLRALLDAARPGAFDWSVMEDGPSTWSVRVAKTKGFNMDGCAGCSCNCGGARLAAQCEML
ncbi:uncharacterized protein (DUF2249 family) [Inhella inkyongensis]|uniref:Uncharacterized protein (DUF2249 family) n=1 Tax=Inhella inkyongensis TaxID=392593 RepID=A0A840S9D7_9BURK|nr:DUF2249 domain-containing protein [Inhella inkyongensis]MBB5205020.1 uncharacterized protein (DUF2249 family) [Inhella inkyongensis]